MSLVKNYTIKRASQVVLVVKNLPAIQEIQEMWVWSLSWEDSLEEKMATHCSVLAWKIPQTEEPGGLQSMGFQSQTNWSSWAHPIKSKKSLPRTLTAAPTQIFPKYSWFSKEKAFIEVSSQFTRKATDSTLLTHPEAGHFSPLPCTTWVWAASVALLDCSNSPITLVLALLGSLPWSNLNTPAIGILGKRKSGNDTPLLKILRSPLWRH